MIVYDDHPLYFKLPALDASAFPTVTTEKSRKLKFYIERQLAKFYKDLGDRETRRRDVCKYLILVPIIDSPFPHTAGE